MRTTIIMALLALSSCSKTAVVGAKVEAKTAYLDLGNGCRLRCWGVEYKGLPYMDGAPGFDGDWEIVGDKLNCSGKDLKVGALACFDQLIPEFDGPKR